MPCELVPVLAFMGLVEASEDTSQVFISNNSGDYTYKEISGVFRGIRTVFQFFFGSFLASSGSFRSFNGFSESPRGSKETSQGRFIRPFQKCFKGISGSSMEFQGVPGRFR